MRVYDQGSGYRVEVSADDVRNFKAKWPASGLATRSFWFEFDKSNGDLVDTNLGEDNDGAAALALSDDAKEYGQKRLARKKSRGSGRMMIRPLSGVGSRRAARKGSLVPTLIAVGLITLVIAKAR